MAARRCGIGGGVGKLPPIPGPPDGALLDPLNPRRWTPDCLRLPFPRLVPRRERDSDRSDQCFLAQTFAQDLGAQTSALHFAAGTAAFAAP